MQDNILSFEDISTGLKHKRLYFVAKECGVSYPTLRRLAEKRDQNFKIKTLEKVSEYILKSFKFKNVNLWVHEVLKDVKNQAY